MLIFTIRSRAFGKAAIVCASCVLTRKIVIIRAVVNFRALARLWMGTVSFRRREGVKRVGRGVNHPPPPNAEVKERVQKYLYSPCGHSWSVLGQNLPVAPLCIRGSPSGCT